MNVNIDGRLTMADHVAALRRSYLFQLRQLRMVRSSLTLEAAFVSSRLDYCNSLLTKLQTVQNAAARVVIGTRKFGHITSHQCCTNFTGYRCVNESPSSTFVVWRRLTWLTCVSPFRRQVSVAVG